MKGFLKFLVLAALIGVAVIVIANAQRKRATSSAPAPAAPWQPPIVETPEPRPAPEPEPVAVETEPEAVVATVVETPELPPEPEPEVAAAEDEGMTPPAEEPPADEARSSSGEPLVSEFAAPGAEAALVSDERDSVEAALDVATEEGMTPHPEAPPEDVALGSDGTPLVSELAAPAAEAAVLDAESALLDALADSEEAEALAASESEGMTPAPVHTAVDIARDSSGAVPAAEGPATGEDLPDFGAMLDEAVADSDSDSDVLSEPDAVSDPEAKDSDFLGRYFDELAATPEEFAAEPQPAPLAAPQPREDLFTSVEEALDDLAPAPIVPPPRRSAESYLDEGNVYFNVGQYGLAIERYGQAVSLDSQLTAAFYNRANAHTRAGEFEEALADYDRALELQPADADALNNRGMLHLYRSTYGPALQDFNRALEIDPSDTTVMVNRGLAHLHGGNAAAALVDFREAAQRDVGDAAAQYGAAQAAASMGNKSEALRHVSRALEIDPGYAREAAADPRLAILAGDEEFMKLLRQSGTRTN